MVKIYTKLYQMKRSDYFTCEEYLGRYLKSFLN